MEVFSAVKSGYGAYRQVKAGFDAACHPLQWVKDQMLHGVKGVLIASLTKRVGEPAAKAAIARLDMEGKTYPMSLTIPLHAKVRGLVSNPEHVALVQEMLNDVLAIPLEALGYRLAEVAFECPDGEKGFVVRAELGLKRLQPLAVEPVKVADVVEIAPQEPAFHAVEGVSDVPVVPIPVQASIPPQA